MEKLWIYCLRALGIVCIVFGQVACEDRKDAGYYFNLQKRFIQGSVKEQKYLDKALELDSLNAEVLVEKSVSFNKRGQYAIGMSYLNKGVEINPVEHLGYRGFVKLYMLRDYEGAIKDFKRLNALTPEFRDSPWGECIYKVIGLSYMKQLNYEKALVNFKTSIDEITKESGEDWVEPRTFLYQGLCLLNRLDFNLAIQAFDKHITYCPECPSGYYYKAKTLMQMNAFNFEDVNQLINHADSLAEAGLIVTSPYFELPYQIYPSDIIQVKQTLLQRGFKP